MSKVKTSELTDGALDWAVCIAKGMKPEDIYIQKWGRLPASLFRRLRDEDGNLDGTYITGPDLLFSRKWEAGGPIIDDEDIAVGHGNSKEDPDHKFSASKLRIHPWPIEARGPTKLIAAMRCFVASRLGDEVEIPEELLK
ncbi:MAG: phage protein NinX family protein [Leptolyngbyaceae bacterium]|nr:phage protein NinX family protein [Leptolyngbyaceae bacterium]